MNNTLYRVHDYWHAPPDRKEEQRKRAQTWRAALFYTVDTDIRGYPVFFLAPGKNELAHESGVYNDPGQASQEFRAQHPDAIFVSMRRLRELVLQAREAMQ